MATSDEILIRPQLLARSQRLREAATAQPEAADLHRLLAEVDAALLRLDRGTFGLCEVCHDPIETDRLLADPLVAVCLDHLSEAEQRDLERDLATAAAVQRRLLPERYLATGGWEVFVHWQPAGVVSGDFCDLVPSAAGGIHVLLGDVAGKGVAAGLITAHLHAAFRTLLGSDLATDAVVTRVNGLFRESALAPHFATLVLGWAHGDGTLELCNAGHCPPLLRTGGEVTAIDPTGMPVGAFYSSTYGARSVRLGPGDTALFYTDGVSEARDDDGLEYGAERLARLLRSNPQASATELVAAVLEDLASHAGAGRRSDDLTVAALRRTG